VNIVTHVRYQNFLAAGNVPIDVDLSTHPTTLVIGINGAGKSTLHEAICFAWFGKPLRKINKSALVNWINGRDCLVELDWTVPNGTAYKVRRGIKPNVFEIFKNGTLEPIPSSLDDYQAHLESIIKLNHKSFMQVVVLGGSSYVPFMRLTTTARRDIIEDLLDIEVFSAMNVLAKEDVSELKVSLEKNTTTRTLLDQQVSMAKQFEVQIEEDTKQRVAEIDVAIAQTNAAITALTEQRDALVIALKPFDAVKDAIVSIRAKVSGYESTLISIHAKTDKETAKTLNTLQSQRDDEAESLLVELRGRQKRDTKERAFYTDHDECPTCEQGITEDFKTKRFTTLDEADRATTYALSECQRRLDEFAAKKASDIAACEAKLAAFEKAKADAIVQCKGLITKHRKTLETTEESLDGANTIQASINGVDAKLPLHRRRVKELDAERVKVLTPKPTAPSVDVDALVAQLAALKDEFAALSKQRVVYDAAAMLLKDNGIKTRLIKHYLPIINKFINSYLSAMNFPIAFTFDDEFEEHIRTHFGDSFAYESFSDGEKKRIDLALLLTWRALARLKNSAACSLLILDEVFDSSLDLAGMEEFLKIIHGLEADARVFVMSHRVDSMIDKFSHTLIFDKVRGFSTLKA
jgi:DNA repair exonuclease SbcCD ATPase subunit